MKQWAGGDYHDAWVKKTEFIVSPAWNSTSVQDAKNIKDAEWASSKKKMVFTVNSNKHGIELQLYIIFAIDTDELM